ncbi:hypothetical protein B4Q13_17380, partial [Lacticaseibacillus rhamnosus]
MVDPRRLDVDGHERQGDMLAGDLAGRILAVLFNEELGAVLQVRKSERDAVMARLHEAEGAALRRVAAEGEGPARGDRQRHGLAVSEGLDDVAGAVRHNEPALGLEHDVLVRRHRHHGVAEHAVRHRTAPRRVRRRL